MTAQRRIEYAQALLSADVKCNAVALLVGYRARDKFYAMFKRATGETPMAYRLRTRRVSLGSGCPTACSGGSPPPVAVTGARVILDPQFIARLRFGSFAGSPVTMARLCRRVGQDHPTLSRWVNGHPLTLTELTQGRLARIAQAIDYRGPCVQAPLRADRDN